MSDHPPTFVPAVFFSRWDRARERMLGQLSILHRIGSHVDGADRCMTCSTPWPCDTAQIVFLPTVADTPRYDHISRIGILNTLDEHGTLSFAPDTNEDYRSGYDDALAYFTSLIETLEAAECLPGKALTGKDGQET